MQSVILELKVLQTCQYRIRGLTWNEAFVCAVASHKLRHTMSDQTVQLLRSSQ